MTRRFLGRRMPLLVLITFLCIAPAVPQEPEEATGEIPAAAQQLLGRIDLAREKMDDLEQRLGGATGEAKIVHFSL